jgi:hypothetical protein
MTAPTPVDVLTVENIATVAGPFIAAVGLILGVWWRVDGKIDEANKKAHTNEMELAAFKLKVAEEYASWDTVKSIENRLTERMDDLSDQVMKLPDVMVDRIMKYLTYKPNA